MVKKPNLILKNSLLTLPPHTFSVQVKSGAGYIKGQWGQVQNKTKKNLTPTLSLLLLSNVFYNKICVFIMIFTALTFLRLIHGLFLI